MAIVFYGFCPHPPVMVPEVGRGQDQAVENTRQAMRELSERLRESGAQTLVMISPHAPLFRDAIGINAQRRLEGDLSRFDAPEVKLSFDADPVLTAAIKEKAGLLGVPFVELDEHMAGRLGFTLALDHGFTAPLYFVRQAGVELPLVAVSMGFLPRYKLYLSGLAVLRAAQATDRNVAFLASGDLSHRLTKDAPAGFSHEGRVFDRLVVERMKCGDVKGYLEIDPILTEEAGECGYRSLLMLLGALDGRQVETDVLSYEGPYGVGYLVAQLKPAGDTPSLADEMTKQLRQKTEEKRAGESFLVRVARETLERSVRGENPLAYDEPSIPREFQKKAGTFVSIKKDGELRGCIGTITPVHSNIVEEVMGNAISAGTADPRFYPVEPEELDDLVYAVDVLGEPEPVEDISGLDPRRYGVIVAAGRRSGLLLPDLEGIDTAKQQVDIARKKAGIGPGETVQLMRFEVKRYH